MANSDKNIRITANRDTTALPKIIFTGQSNNPIALNVLDDNTISFEGSAGQLFSINNNLSSGYIFSINDISGIPSFRVNADGTVGIAEFLGNVGIGLTNPAYKLQISGSAGISGTANISGVLTLSSTTGSGSTSTGALVVSGGVGIGGSIFSSSAYASSLSGVVFNNGAITNTGTITSTGVMSISNSSTTAFQVRDGSNNPAFVIDTIGDIISLPVAIASTTTGTGSLVVAGGVGIGQTLFTSPSYASSVSGVILNNGTITGSLSGTATTANNVRIASAGNSNSNHLITFTPNSSSSGSAISSDSTFSFNPSTEILSVSGLAITSGTASTSITTGSLIVAGGVGIGNTLYVAGRVDASNYKAWVENRTLSSVDTCVGIGTFLINNGAHNILISLNVSDGGYSAAKNYSLTSYYNIGGWFIVAPTSSMGGYNNNPAINFQLEAYQGGNYLTLRARSLGTGGNLKIYVQNVGQNTATFTAYNSATSETAISSYHPSAFVSQEYYNFKINSSTASTSTSTGALVVTGGVGIGQSLFTSSSYASSISGVTFNNGTITNTGTITSTGVMSISNSSTTAFAVKDGSNSSKFNVDTVGGIVSVLSSTASTSTSSGALVVSGGVGIGGSVIVGGRVGIGTVPNLSMLNIQTSSAGTTGLSISASTSQSAPLLEWWSYGGIIGLNQSGRIKPTGELYLGIQTVANLSSGTNPLFSLQGRGATEGMLIKGFNSGASEVIFEVQGNTAAQLFGIYGDGGVNAPRINVTNSTGSTSTSTGALIVSGGVGIGGSLYVASATAISGVTINAGVITGSLTGTATTSTYSHQSGYAITSGSSATATTATYAHQSGYATTSGLATTSTYSHQSGYATTSGSATTATYSHQSGYGITAGLATTATYSHQSGYAITSGSSGSATTANNINVVNALSNSAHTLLFSPTATGSGVAVSSNTTLSYNPSTNYLYTSGLAVTASTASSSTSNGALQVAGGVGISGRLSFNQAAFGTTGIATNPTMAMIGNTGDPIFLSILEDNTISFEGSQGQLFSITPNLSTGYIYSVNDITGIPLLRANANANVTANEYAGNFGIGLSNPGYKLHVVGSVGFTSTTASTSTTTGTLIVSGGVGIGGSLNVNSPSNISSVILNNGVITGNLTGTATTSGFATTASYSNQAGYAITAGSSNTSGYATTSGLATTATYSYQSGYGLTSGFATTASYAYQSGYGLTSGFATTASYSHQAGYAITAGSATTAFTAVSTTSVSVASAGNSNLAHPILITNNPSSGSAVSSDSTFTFNPSTEILSVSGISVTSTTASTSYNSGALVVSGGVGIGGSLFVNGDLTINGTTTTINSVTISVDDKNIELGSVSSPSDVTAEGGGITLKGATDKFINWYSGVGWSSSESWNLISGNSYKINNASVLNATTLGTGVTNSSLTSLGTITTGVWAGTLITANYGGVGFTTPFTVGDILYANTSTTWGRLTAGTSGHLLSSTGTGSTPSYVNPNTLTVGSATTASNLRIAVASSNLSHPVLFTPGSSTSGSAVSSDSTFSFNSSTEILSVSGVAITSTTSSSGSTTGALIVAGGVGIGGTVNIAGDETVLGRLYYSQSTVGVAGTSTIPSISFIGQDNNPITLSVLTDNTLSFEGSSGQLFSINNNLSSGTIFSVNDISGIPIIRANANGTLSMGEFTGTVGVGLTNPSFKFHVSGSAGFSGTIYATGNVSLASNTASTSTTNGALTVAGGVGIGGSLYVASATAISGVTINAGVITGSLTGTASTATYSHQSGYAITSGFATTASYAYQSGYAITSGSSGSAITAFNINIVSATTNASHPVLFTPASGTASGAALSTESAFVYNPSTDILSVSGLAITSGAASTSPTTGALVVIGGVGIGQSLFTSSSYASSISGVILNNGAITNTGTITSTGVMSISNSSTTAFQVRDGSNDTKFNVNTIGGIVSVSSSTASTNTSTGAFTVTGGVGIGGTLNANSVITYNKLQNQSFSGSSLGATDGRSINLGALIGHGIITYGNGIFVTNSSWGAYNAAYSTDGISWTASSLPVNQGYPVSMYGNGYFVLVASGATNVMYSTNGQSWSQVSIGNTFNRTDGVYGNGKYVVVGNGQTYNYSSNLTTWTSETLPLTGDWRIAYGNGTFVALGYGTRKIIYSYDGIYWNIANTKVEYALNWTGLKYANGRFIASVYSGGGSAYSLDGINWYSAVGTGGENLDKISYGNGVYFVSSTGNYYTSGDGTTYNNSTPWSVAYEAGNTAYGLGKFQAIGRWIDGPTNTVTIEPKFTGEINNVRIGAITPASGDFTNLSSTGSANLVGTVNAYNLNIISKVSQSPVLGGFAGTSGWTSSGLLTGNSNYALAFGNGLFVQIRRSTDYTSYSPDGRQWVASNMPFSGSWIDIAWGKDKFVAVSSTGASGSYSGNGITWSSMNMPTNTSGWYALTYGDEKFVAVGNGATVAYSSDGISWTGSAIANTNWTGIAYGNGTFVAVSGNGSSGAYSYDGLNWNYSTIGGVNNGIKFITYGNGYFIVTNYVSTAINYSRDGINWSTSTRTSTFSIHTDLAYGNGVYTTFNYQEASYSYDAINWLNGNTIAATDWQAVAYGNNRFVATSVNTGNVATIDGPSNTLNLHPKFTGDIDNVRIGAKQPGAAEFTNLAAQQPVRFTSNTASINTNTGALVVVGGVGIGGSLFVTSATAISGVTINAGVITGSLTGTASTATYSHQSGYAITSGSSGLATTATYSHQSGYATTSGLATTATYAHQSGYATTSGLATTATYSYQSGYGITAGFATSSTSASIANTSYSVNVNAASANASHFLIFSPTATGSGVALSSESALVYNPSTDILSVSGLAVTSGTASTSATTGALVVTGGVGIGLTLTVGLGISTPIISAPANLLLKPGVDSTTGIQFTRSSAAVPVLTIDTLNSRVGIGLTNPEFDFEVNGSISATTKSFVIEHPTKQGMKLRYGSLEGPENGVYVRGELKDNNTIILPDYWSELVDHSTITIHLTPIGNKTVFVKEIRKDKVIVGARLFQKIHCFYSIWAERQDVPKLKVEF